MAKLELTGSRKPLANGLVGRMWQGDGGIAEVGEQYVFMVEKSEPIDTNRTKSRNYRFSMSRAEMLSTVDWVAHRMTFNAHNGGIDRRSTVEKLRALADKLEAEDTQRGIVRG